MKSDSIITDESVQRWRRRLYWLPFIQPVAIIPGILFGYSIFPNIRPSFVFIVFMALLTLLLGHSISIFLTWRFRKRIAKQETRDDPRLFYSFVGIALGVSIGFFIVWFLVGALLSDPTLVGTGAGGVFLGIIFLVGPLSSMIAGVLGFFFGWTFQKGDKNT
jgi:hypothetical protein